MNFKSVGGNLSSRGMSRMEFEPYDDTLSNGTTSTCNIRGSQIQVLKDCINYTKISPSHASNKKTLLHRSVMSVGGHSNNSKQRAIDKQSFVVKKSVKVLTIPDGFELNTNRRAVDRSLSQNRLNSENSTCRGDRSINIRKGSFVQSSNIGGLTSRLERRHQSIKADIKPCSVNDKIKITDYEDQPPEPDSLMQRLIKEFNLENAFS
jgi:hypothetical protein